MNKRTPGQMNEQNDNEQKNNYTIKLFVALIRTF